MYNEHSVCEREIEDLKEEVEYYKISYQGEIVDNVLSGKGER